MWRVYLLSLALLACVRAYPDPAGKAAGDANAVISVTGELGNPLLVTCLESKNPTLFVFWYRGHGKGKLLRNDAVYGMRRNALLIRNLAIDTLGPYTCQAYNSGDMKPPRIIVVRAYMPDGTSPSDSDWLLLRDTGPPSSGTQPPSPGTQPPSPRTQPSSPGTQPPSPETQPPSPGTQPPSPRTQPSSPGTQPPSPRTQPSSPGTQPPSPETQPPSPGTQPPSPRTQPSSPGTQLPSPRTQPSSPGTQPPSPETQPPSPGTQPPSSRTQPSSPGTQPPSPRTQPSSPGTQPPSPETQPPSPGTQPPSPRTQPSSPGTQPPSPRTQPSSPGTQPPSPETQPPSPGIQPLSPGTQPPSPGPQPTTSAETSTTTMTITTTEALELDVETEVTASEGGIATLRSPFSVQNESWMKTNTSRPTIWWDFGGIKIDGNTSRYRLLSDGALEIVPLYRNDTGVYTFTALNMFGKITQRIHLVVNDHTVLMPAGIAGDENAMVTGELGRPLEVRCLAYGFPPPTVYWYNGFDEEAIVLYNDTDYAMRGNVLTIIDLNLDTLGDYTCGAYNGIGEVALWKVIVQANMPEDPFETANDLTQPRAQPSTTEETTTTGLLSNGTSAAGGLFETTQETTEAFGSEISVGTTITDGTTTLDPCSSFEFGCCADNETEATGSKKEGCPETKTSTKGVLIETVHETTVSIETSEGSTTSEGTTDVGTTTLDPCSGFEFGCCADNETEATGPGGQGCPCNATEFGCCPDEVSPASGLENEGCPGPCSTSPHGCCQDDKTPAHGPDFEGCCLLQAFGCCPDNRKPAEGPHLEGCGCQSAFHGCCPDNVTIAQGPDNQGCGCQYTVHGCCPDRHTAALGHNNEGCACNTYQFGCCADGVTTAMGPEQQGCHCRESKFGCCGDDETPATGPDSVGCDCSSSKHGCCPDGRTEATGPKFLGCTDAPENKQAACSISTDPGSCHNFTVMWYYDMAYGGCSRFWYGGCDGNGNRFSTKEECEDVCVQPSPKDACKLPSVKGACDADYQRWHYNSTLEQCIPFRYGGCLGNDNNFDSQELCQKQCEPSSVEGQCDLPIDQGSCAGNYSRWGFNSEAHRCEQFIWGGCEGNSNRFSSEAACQMRCAQHNQPPQCTLPREPGNCTMREALWSFSQLENRCMPFYYSGCGGNDNRFSSKEVCEQICPSAYVPDKCTLPAETGQCSNYRERWFYDTTFKRCRQFYYGGCGGNENNFGTEAECDNSCSEIKTTTTTTATATTTTTTTITTTTTTANSDELQPEVFCFDAIDVGLCNNYETRYAYDSELGSCVTFQYGGCGGNQNNFPDEVYCSYYCQPMEDICTLPMLQGPCYDSLKRWFYDFTTDSCYQFTYGGCEGNDNRFESIEDCEYRCRTEPAPVASTTPTTTVIAVEPPECIVPYTLEDCRYGRGGEVWFFDPSRHECVSHANQEAGPVCRHTGTFPSQEACERSCGAFRGVDVPAAPVALSQPKPEVLASEGGSATLRCLFHSNPPPKITWTFGELTIDGSKGRYRLTSDGALEIVSLYRNDTGVYICVADNGLGVAKQAIHLFVNGSKEINEVDCDEYVANCSRLRCEYGVQRARLPNGCEKCSCDCEPLRQECNLLKCNYVVEKIMGTDGCERCQCIEYPCKKKSCRAGQRCVVQQFEDGLKPETKFAAECRSIVKAGVCPMDKMITNEVNCRHECGDDADCRGVGKCCRRGCSDLCLVPVEQTSPHPHRTTSVAPNVPAAPLALPLSEPEVKASEGGVTTLRVRFRGNPPPKITWRFGNHTIDGHAGRYKVLSDGALQIVSLYRSDTGVYICLADNGLGVATQVIHLVVNDPVRMPAGIAGDDNAMVTGVLGSPLLVRCLAYGYPPPTVSWYRGDTRYVFSPFVRRRHRLPRRYSNALRIRSLALENLGQYTCRAYNGEGKAASWVVFVRAYQPEGLFIENELLVPRNTLSPRPRTQPPTTAKTTTTTTTTTEAPRLFFTVPVSARVSAPYFTLNSGADLRLRCEVDGFPFPDVHWTKDGATILAYGRITITSSTFVSRLMVARVSEADSGLYTCHASNRYTSQSDTAQIKVHQLVIPAKCTDIPFFGNCEQIVRSKRCKHKYYSKVCCKSCVEAGQLDPSDVKVQADQWRSKQSFRKS